MEHRWGNRIQLELPVMIVTAAGERGFGILRNFSSSGGYIETILPVSPLAPVQVQLHSPYGGPEQGPSLPGFVVRSDARGLGVEWSDAAELSAADLMPVHVPARRSA